MENVKRIYVYLTSAVGLHSVTWAVIGLLRELFRPGIRGSAENFAMQIAIILIGLPLFVIHWRWAQTMAAAEQEEKASPIRSLYLYATLAGTLTPALANLYTLVVEGLIHSSRSAIPASLVAIPVMALLFYYHAAILRNDDEALEEEGSPTVRRLYQLAFSGAGLVMLGIAFDNLLSLLLILLGSRGDSRPFINATIGGINLYTEIVRLLMGLGIWVFFWMKHQRDFEAEAKEQTTPERKVYLYLVVLVATIGTLINTAILFAGWLRKAFSLPSEGSLDEYFPALIVMGVVWAYHAYVLRRHDAMVSPAENRRVRRIYIYIVAAVGLGAFLGGLVGEINVLVDILFRSLTWPTVALKERVAYSTAALLVSLPTWLLPWRAALHETVDEAAGEEARRSMPRRIYLYLYLFVAVMTILGSLIAIVYQLLLVLFGEQAFSEIGREATYAISYSLIAALLLVYHGRLVRADDQRVRRHKAERIADLNILVLDGGDGSLGAALAAALKNEFNGLEPLALGLTAAAQERLGSQPGEGDVANSIAAAGLLIAPWAAATGGDGVPASLAQAITRSPARKLLLPLPAEGLDWVGQESHDQRSWVRQTVQAVKQILSGDEVARKKGIGCGGWFAILIALFILLNILEQFLF